MYAIRSYYAVLRMPGMAVLCERKLVDALIHADDPHGLVHAGKTRQPGGLEGRAHGQIEGRAGQFGHLRRFGLEGVGLHACRHQRLDRDILAPDALGDVLLGQDAHGHSYNFV